MTLDEIKSRVIFQANADEDDLTITNLLSQVMSMQVMTLSLKR